MGYGLDTNDAVEIGNPDSDPYTTLEEWILDTDPTNATEALRIEWSGLTQVTTAWSSTGRTYRVRSEAALPAGSWTSVVAQSMGTGTNLDLTVDTFTTNAPHGALRIEVSLP
ncbi:MAG: hypothetical protein KJ626_00810 [Verrucomicrobia bacterium]|nr:hypothetical protein [Verrucomicrobiota bacterium]